MQVSPQFVHLFLEDLLQVLTTQFVEEHDRVDAVDELDLEVIVDGLFGERSGFSANAIEAGAFMVGANPDFGLDALPFPKLDVMMMIDLRKSATWPSPSVI